PAPRGLPKIEVTFDIDANGIVHVSAKDQGTGKEQSMTISGGSALSKDDIDRMVKDAEQYAEEDAKRREAVESRNQADSLVYTTEKFLSENDQKIPDEIKSEVQADVDELKKLLADDNTDKDAFNGAITKLGASSQKMGTAMYESAAAESAAAEGAQGADAASGTGTDGSTEGDDEVVDAEIVDEPTGTEGTDGTAGPTGSEGAAK
ncbi:MAG: Hsp70 family protein, partial [Actinomycetota bacterium]|nr:Hsp70 family protein [Actinomycetota bacterium]